MARPCVCGADAVATSASGTPLCLDHATRHDLYGVLWRLRAASRAYLDARDRSDPPGEKAAREALEALL